MIKERERGGGRFVKFYHENAEPHIVSCEPTIIYRMNSIVFFFVPVYRYLAPIPKIDGRTDGRTAEI